MIITAEMKDTADAVTIIVKFRRFHMFQLFKKKNQEKHAIEQSYDPVVHKPVIRCGICTGEQVAGFKDLHTGKFTDIMLIRNEKDLQSFKETYGVTEITKEF